MATQKKLTRGISSEFAKAFNECELSKLYKDHKDELIIGIRNNYLNLYYNCDSIAKVAYNDKKITCEIDRYYLEGNHYKGKGKSKKTTSSKIREKYDTIKINSDRAVKEKLKQSKDEEKARSKTNEKKAQSKLVILNNQNSNSAWYCLDIEWKKAFKSQVERDKEKFNGRFDIIAISTECPHKVALIELKYGSGAIGGKSGIYKHVEDFHKFKEKNYFETMKLEIAEIIKCQKMLGMAIPEKLRNLQSESISCFEFYVITLSNNPEKEKGRTPKQTMAGYLFEKKRWGCKRLSQKTKVEGKFGDVTNKTNEQIHINFLFSTQTLDNLNINDIIDGEYDERI